MFQSQPNRHISSRSKSFVQAGPKCDVFREGRFSGRTFFGKKRHKLKKIFSCARASHSSQKCDASHFLSPKKVTNVTSSETGSWEEIRVRVFLSPNGLPASRFRDKWQIWDGKRKTCFSPSRIVTFLHVQIFFVQAGPTFFGKDVTKNVFREGCDKKHHKLKNIFSCARASHSSQKCDRCDTSHFCHRKKWQMSRHPPKSETGSWE